jgi:hypothetical protein
MSQNLTRRLKRSWGWVLRLGHRDHRSSAPVTFACRGHMKSLVHERKVVSHVKFCVISRYDKRVSPIQNVLIFPTNRSAADENRTHVAHNGVRNILLKLWHDICKLLKTRIFVLNEMLLSSHIDLDRKAKASSVIIAYLFEVCWYVYIWVMCFFHPCFFQESSIEIITLHIYFETLMYIKHLYCISNATFPGFRDQ